MEIVLHQVTQDPAHEAPETEQGQICSSRPGIIARLFRWVMGRHEESEYEDYFNDIDPQTFRLDPAIWNWYRKDRPGIGYYRQLHTAYEILLKNSGAFALYDPETIEKKFNEMLTANCDLERELARTKGEMEALQTRLNWALEHQTATGKKAEVLTLEGRGDELKAPSAPREAQKREGGRFVSASGRGKTENQMAASAYLACGWELPEIAEKLGLKSGTLTTYLAEAKGHYDVKYIQNRRYICFDQKYNYTKWDLCFYARLEEKFRPLPDAEPEEMPAAIGN